MSAYLCISVVWIPSEDRSQWWDHGADRCLVLNTTVVPDTETAACYVLARVRRMASQLDDGDDLAQTFADAAEQDRIRQGLESGGYRVEVEDGETARYIVAVRPRRCPWQFLRRLRPRPAGAVSSHFTRRAER